MTDGTMTDIGEVLQALDSGLLADRIGAALSEIALQTCMMHDLSDGKAKGKLILTLEVSCIDPVEGAIRVAHKLVKLVPHKSGKATNETGGRSRLWAAKGGKMVEVQPAINGKGQKRLDLDQELGYSDE